MTLAEELPIYKTLYDLLKKKIYLILILILVVPISTFTQEIKISIANSPADKAELHSLIGENTNFVDSIFADLNYYFIYNGENLKNGFYHFRISGKPPITFIFSGKDIELKADAETISETLQVVKSVSNKIYYDYVDLNIDYKTKTELLQLILARYPKDDDFHQITVDKIIQLQSEYRKFIESYIAIDPKSFIARYVHSSQLPIVDYTLPVEEQMSYLKSHALDNVDFDDAELIYSDCFTNKTIEYLTYYRNPQLPKKILEQEFQKAVDTLLTKASVNILVYQQIADYMIDGFKQFGFDNVVDYIINNYVVKDELCLDEETENSIENRINQSKLLKIGASVPNVILPDTAGKLFDISKIDKEKILLLFYASWCPHCQEMLPEIHELYKQRNDLEVVAISLEEDKEAWINYIKDNRLEWINISDLKGWESQAAKDYYIYSTPTFFLLDANRKIIGTPITIDEFSNLL